MVVGKEASRRTLNGRQEGHHLTTDWGKKFEGLWHIAHVNRRKVVVDMDNSAHAQVVSETVNRFVVVGALLGGPISDGWGRKRTLILAALLFGLGALLAGYSPNVAVLVAARVLLGLAIGIASMIVPVYIAEIAPPRVRG